jgi:hypothetical protein
MKGKNRKEKIEKGRSPDRIVNWKVPLAVIILRHAQMPEDSRQGDVRAFRSFCTTCSLAADEAALILARFYMSPPANPSGLASKETAFGINNRPDSTFSVRPGWYSCQ